MDPLLLVNEDHPDGGVGGGHHCQDVPERQTETSPLGAPWRACFAWCTRAPSGPTRCGGNYGACHRGALGNHLAEPGRTPWQWTGDTFRGVSKCNGGDALFMFSFKRAVVMDEVPQLAVTLDEDDILLYMRRRVVFLILAPRVI